MATVTRELSKLRAWWLWYYARGWMPVVLTSTDALSYPQYTELEAHFAALPTVNMRAMELSCYVRWMALSAQGGGLLIDYDIFDLSDTSAYIELSSSVSSGNTCDHHSALTSYYNHFPMITHGNSSEIARWVTTMSTYQLHPTDVYDNQPHISDMLVAAKLFDSGDRTFERRPSIGWYHFSHHAMRQYESQPMLPFARLMLQLHFLSHHTVRLLTSDTTTIHFARALTLCPSRAVPTLPTVDDHFCDIGDKDSVDTVAARERRQLCELIRPVPWRMVDVVCRWEVLDGDDGVSVKATDVWIGLVADPVKRVIRRFGSIVTNVSDVSEWQSLLSTTRRSPLLYHLTRHMPQTPLQDRWDRVQQLLAGSRTLLLAEEVLAGSASEDVAKLVGLVVGFELSASQLPLYATTEFNVATVSVSIEVAELINEWHAVDVELYRQIVQQCTRYIAVGQQMSLNIEHSTQRSPPSHAPSATDPKHD